MGFLLAVLSALLNTTKDLLSKRLASLVDGTTSTFASFAYALPFYALLLACLYFAGFEVVTFSKQFALLVLLRSLSDAGAEWTKMQALACGEISLIAPFLSLAPLFLLFFSPLITGDPLTLSGVIAIALSVAGSAVLLWRPVKPHGQQAVRGIFLALGASFFFALNTCFDRLTVQIASPVFSGFMMTIVAAIFFLPTVCLRGARVKALSIAWLPLIGRGALEVAYMVTKLIALTYFQAPYVMAVGRLSLVFSIVGGHLLFKEGDFQRRIIAGILIVGGALVVMLWHN